MDDKETQVEQVAPATDETQAEPASPAKEGDIAPETASDKVEERLLAGKFKSVEDLEKSYQELQSSFTKERQAMAQDREQVPDQGYAPYTPPPQLDEDSARAVDFLVEQKLAQKQTNRFLAKHRDELKDPILAGTVGQLINRAVGQGLEPDHEELLQEAKKMLDERVKPQIKQAQAQGVEQGEDIAKKKGELGAVGESGPTPKVDPDKLSAEEFKKYHGLTYEE